MILDYDNEQLVITGSPLDRDLITTINGLRAEGSGRWVAPAHWPILVDASSAVKEYGGTQTPAVTELGKIMQSAMSARVAAKDGTGTPRPLGAVELFPGQVADAEWLADADGSGFLFSDLRSGKTFTICEAINLLPKAFPALIVCPPGITFEWDRALTLAFPDKPRAVLSNGMTALQRKKALEAQPDIVVIGYNNLAKHSKVAYYGGLSKEQRAKELDAGLYAEKELNDFHFRTIVADEAHNAKAPKSQQTRALWILGDAAQYRIAATGTPTSKKITDGSDITHSRVDISDLWALFRFVYPLDFPSRSKFMNKYLLVVNNFFGIPEVKGLHPARMPYWKLVFEPMYLRRLRSIQTQKEPPRVIPVELASKDRKAYKQFATEYMAEIGDELEVVTDALSLRHKLIEICNGAAKLAVLMEWLDETDTKAIVFTTRTSAFNLIEDELQKAGVQFVSFPGGLKDGQKKAVTDTFRTNENVKVILCAIGATNAGIDLSAAKRTCYFGISDDPTFMLQSEDRALGPTQTSATYEITYLIAKGTVEEDMYEAFADKEANTKVLFNDPNWIRRHLHA